MTEQLPRPSRSAGSPSTSSGSARSGAPSSRSRAPASFVRELRAAGFGCHLATNQDDLRASYMRSRMGYDDLLDRCFYSCEVGAAKPDEEFFRRVAGELGVELRELVFVDDTLENVHAAQACGLPAILWHHRDGVDVLRERSRPWASASP